MFDNTRHHQALKKVKTAQKEKPSLLEAQSITYRPPISNINVFLKHVLYFSGIFF